MSEEEGNPLATFGGILPATGGGIRAGDVITVPEGEVGKPQRPRPKNRNYALQQAILPPNWITYATVRGQQPITHFESTWEVPELPSRNNGQLIYLFNGLQNAARNQILQPVLQLGPSPWGGGFYWSTIPVFVDAAAGKVQIPPVNLQPLARGTPLTGYIHLLGQAGGRFTYECGFTSNGRPGPRLQMATDMMVEAVEVLEAYKIVQAGNYPAQAMTTFSSGSLMVGGMPVHPAWARVDKITNYDQHTVPWPDGHVDIHYGAA